MNPMTGELRMFNSRDDIPEEFERIPAMLRREAMEVLAGKESTFVDMNGPSSLVHWAKKKAKNRKREKIAAASRRRNRK